MKWLFVGIFAPLGLLLFIAIGGEIVRLLWNWLVPPIIGWREITFWQAVGLLALCRILFGGFGFRGRGGPRMHKRWRPDHMDPAERERFRQRMRERWCGPVPTESKGQ